MKAEIIRHQQGSDAWHKHRATHLNASDCAAAMGLSSYKTRSQLLHEKSTGITPEIDAQTQKRFDRGHEFEAIARPWAEELLGDSDLFPVVLAGEFEGLKLSASLDGLTMDRPGISFEHKSGNADLLASLERGIIPDQYHPQMEMGLMLSGAEKCMFMASSGNRDEMRWAWYLPNLELRAKIIAAWHQFMADLAAYVPPVAEVKAVAAPQFGLPAVSIQVNGSIALIDNLQVFGAALTAYIERINTRPETDQDFADLEATVKTLKNAEDALDSAESGALAQTESIDVMRRTVAMYRETARTNRLLIDKLVKSEKEARKLAIVSEAAAAFVSHIHALNERIGSKLMPPVLSDFPGAAKGLKSLDSMRDKVANELARCKIEANAVADKITLNLKAIKDQTGFDFLFSDVATLVLKEPEFVAMAIKNRIADHQEKESARLAAETARIAEQERVKAEAAARAKSAEEDALIASLWNEARRIEFDRVPYIKKAIAAFETAAMDWESDPRPRVAEAVAFARKEMTDKLTAATAREQADAEVKRVSDEAIAKAQAEHPAAVAAVAQFDEDVRVMLTKEPAQARYIPHSATPPTLKLGVICTRLGFQVTADFLKSLGFEPAGRERAAVLFHESDFDRICAALISHISAVRQGVTA